MWVSGIAPINAFAITVSTFAPSEMYTCCVFMFLCTINEVMARLFWICINYAKYNSFEMFSNVKTEFSVICYTWFALIHGCFTANSLGMI